MVNSAPDSDTHAQEHLGVAAGGGAIPFFLQVRAKFLVVIDFAVEGSDQALTGSRNGLTAVFGEIDDDVLTPTIIQTVRVLIISLYSSLYCIAISSGRKRFTFINPFAINSCL